MYDDTLGDEGTREVGLGTYKLCICKGRPETEERAEPDPREWGVRARVKNEEPGLLEYEESGRA